MKTTCQKFSSFNNFESTQPYELLPFRFIKLDQKRYVITNFVGEYLIISHSDLISLVNKTIDKENLLHNDLLSKNFIRYEGSKLPISLLSMKYRTKHQDISQFTSLHIFVVSLRCDHSCPYCQVSRQSQDRMAFDMSEQTADKALDFTFKSPSKQIKIEFQGGESLLNFNLIKYIVLKAKAINEFEKRNIQFVIATNLSTINDEMLVFCREYDIHISTSLDGPPYIHNKNRPFPGQDSHKKTIEGIKRSRLILGKDKISALMTTTELSLNHVREIIDEYLEQGFSSIFLRPLSPYGFAIKTKAYDSYQVGEWLEFYMQGLSYILDLNKNGINFVEIYTAIILNKILTPFSTGYVDLQSPAGIGISAIVFNYDGDIYASDEARMLAEMGEKKFKIGNLYRNSYEEVMLSEKLIDPIVSSLVEAVPACNDCGFQPFCGSDPVYHYATQGDFVGNKMYSGFCKKNMSIMKHIFQIMENDKESKEILYSWARV